MGPDRFTEFWQEYPRKIARGLCHRKWLRTGANEDPELFELIMASLWEHKKLVQWKPRMSNGRKTYPFVPHPSTWLGQKRWESDLSGEEKVTPKVREYSELSPEEKYQRELAAAERSKRGWDAYIRD